MEIKHGFAFKGEFFRENETPYMVLTPGNFRIGGGFDPGKKKYYDGPVPCDFALPAGELLVTMTDLSRGADTLGFPAFVPETPNLEYLHNQRLGRVLVKDDRHIDKRFLYYLFCTREYRHEVLASATGTTVKHTSPSRILAYTPCLPPLSEQRAIARILGVLDDKIELSREMNRTMEAMAQAIFKSWFVDFDPVTAEAAGQKPFGMDADTAVLFPDRFVESELGPIPAGWEATSLGKVMEIFDSKRIPLSKAQRLKRPGPYPYYGAAGVFDYIDDFIFEGIHVLVGEDGSVIDKNGFPVTQYVWGKYWVNNHAHVLKGMPPISTELLLLHFKATSIGAYVTGAVQPKLNQRNLKSVPFVKATDPVLEAFDTVLQPLFLKLRANTEESRTLANLRDTLLPKLLSGEIRVGQAEKEVERAV